MEDEFVQNFKKQDCRFCANECYTPLSSACFCCKQNLTILSEVKLVVETDYFPVVVCKECVVSNKEKGERFTALILDELHLISPGWNYEHKMSNLEMQAIIHDQLKYRTRFGNVSQKRLLAALCHLENCEFGDTLETKE